MVEPLDVMTSLNRNGASTPSAAPPAKPDSSPATSATAHTSATIAGTGAPWAWVFFVFL